MLLLPNNANTADTNLANDLQQALLQKNADLTFRTIDDQTDWKEQIRLIQSARAVITTTTTPHGASSATWARNGTPVVVLLPGSRPTTKVAAQEYDLLLRAGYLDTHVFDPEQESISKVVQWLHTKLSSVD